MTVLTYNPNIFNISSIADARAIILTPEDDLTTDERWKLETPYLLELMEANYTFHENTVVLDYGAGIGRLAKELIKKYNCKVIGVDISPNMRSLGNYHVSSDNYVSCHPHMLQHLNVKVDYVIAVWVLQHCLAPKDDINQIYRCMKSDAQIFVVNNKNRVVPVTEEGYWADDGINLQSLLNNTFNNTFIGKLDQKIVSNAVSRGSFYGIWAKNKNPDRSEEEIVSVSDADIPVSTLSS
ncbi:MAG TPA: class I SAM-dependent methyltransferase [Methylomirabilota bacterium]|nr:class I SAM-dependent methyltransferase [Methylomirabilota bacterium]